MANSQEGAPNAAAESIAAAALSAFTRGAGRRRVTDRAAQVIRDRFLPKIWQALSQPDWEATWERERMYLIASAAAVGQCAKTLAAEEGRQVITDEDVDAALIRLRGYMPVAARWCPL